MNASTPFGADMKQLAEYTKLLTHNLIFENLFLPWATYWQTGFLKPWYVIPLRTKSWHPNSSKESFWSIYLALSRNGGRPKYKKLSTLCGNWSQAQLLIIYNWQLRSSNARSALNQCITPKCSIMNAASNPPTNVVIWFLLVMTIDPVTVHGPLAKSLLTLSCHNLRRPLSKIVPLILQQRQLISYTLLIRSLNAKNASKLASAGGRHRQRVEFSWGG